MSSIAYPVTWLTLSSTPRVLAFSQSQLSVVEYFPHNHKSINKLQQTTPPACIWSHQTQKCGQKKNKRQGGSRTTVVSLKWIASGFSWAGHKAGWRCNAHVTDTGRWADICCTGSSEGAFCLRHGISLTLSWTGSRCENPHTSSSGLSLAVRGSVTLRLLKGLTFIDSRRGVGGFPSAPCLTDLKQEYHHRWDGDDVGSRVFQSYTIFISHIYLHCWLNAIWGQRVIHIKSHLNH